MTSVVDERATAAFELERAWQACVTAALLGTERQRLADFATAPGLPRLESDGGALGEARRLLHTASALALMRRAGRIPEGRRFPLPDVVEADDRPHCSPFVAHQLNLLSDGELEELLPEWLTLVEARGVRLPAELVPRLLDLAARGVIDRRCALCVAGPLGPWLARSNPAWRELVPRAFDSTAFGAADRGGRARMLADCRAQSKEAARERIAAEIAAEPAKERHRWLSILRDGLSLGDAPLLTRALDDRSAAVSALALDLLLSIPGSEPSRRLVDVARRWLRIEPIRSEAAQRALSSLRGALIPPTRLVVELPVAAPPYFDVDRSADPSSQSAKAWLSFGVARVPSEVWCAEIGVERVPLLEALFGSEHESLLFGAFVASALRFTDVPLADALVWTLPESELAAHDPAIVAMASDEALERTALRELSRFSGPMHAPPLVLRARLERRAPLGEEIVAAVSGPLGSTVETIQRPRGRELDALAEGLALRAPLAMLPALVAQWSRLRPAGNAWLRLIDRTLAILAFRAEMHKEVGR
ncbi:MAG: hypothetical protein KC609_21645 [Myxococcales bacterium]|nr:hypothetical protein [Myxococcales bacterium]